MPAVLPHLIRRVRRSLLDSRLRARAGTEPGAEACGPGSKPLEELVDGYSRMVDTFVYPYPTLVRDDPRSFAKATRDVKVAVIGTGFTGFTAAYELSRAGITEIHMYEGRSDIGGRADSPIFTDDQGREYVNELGPMRVPENSKLFWHYLSVLQDPPSEPLGEFPNPGVVASEIIYQGSRWQWIGDDLPEPWAEITADIGLFLDQALVYDDGQQRLTLARITELLKQPELSAEEMGQIRTYWSFFVEKYENRSFIESLLDFFDGQDGRPEWGPEKVDMFSTLGLGTGGFGPLFPVCFLEIFRLFLWEYSEEYMPNLSMRGVIELFREATEPTLHFETVSYVGIDRADPSKVDVHSIRPGAEGEERRVVRQYDYVIVATTLRSMQIRMNLDGPDAPSPFADRSSAPFAGERHAALRQSIRVPHIMNSSKLFGFLPKKPWEASGDWPRVGCDGNEVPVKCVLTDSLARQMYFLDPYPEDPEAGVNVLISYNWGDDSVKIMAIEDYQPSQVIEPGSNSDFALKSAYQLGLESASLCDHVAESLRQIGIEDQDRWLESVIWQKEPLIFGAFKIDYPQQYHYTSQVVYQYQNAQQGASGDRARIFLANNNCSFQGGWIEGAMQSAVNAASAVLRAMEEAGEAEDFRMQSLFVPNPFGEVLDKLMEKYRKTIPEYR